MKARQAHLLNRTESLCLLSAPHSLSAVAAQPPRGRRVTAPATRVASRCHITRRHFLTAATSLAAFYATTGSMLSRRALANPAQIHGLLIQRADAVTLVSASDPGVAAESIFAYNGPLRLYRLNPDTKRTEPIVLSENLAPMTATLSPKGNYFLYGTHTNGRAQVHVRDTNDRQEGVFRLNQSHLHDCVWSPDGEHFVARSVRRKWGGGGEVTVFRVRKEPEAIAIEPRRRIEHTNHLPAFSPAGDQMAICDGQGGIVIERSATGSVLKDESPSRMKPIRDKKTAYWNPQWSPNGKHLLLVGEPEHRTLELFVASFHDGKAPTPVRLGSRTSRTWHTGLDLPGSRFHDFPPLGFAAWSPDSKFIAYQADRTVDEYRLAQNWDLFLHDLDLGTTVELTTAGRLPPPSALRGRAVHWSPDGKEIAFIQVPADLSFDMLPMSFGSRADENPFPMNVCTVRVGTTPQEPRELTEGFADVVLAWR